MRKTERACPWTPRLGCVLVVALALGAASAGASTAVVETVDGRTFQGELVRQAQDHVVLNIEGIDASIPQSDVSTLRLLDEPGVIYRQRRAALQDSDLAGRLDLAVAMYDVGATDLAQQEVAQVLIDFPQSPEAQQMQVFLEAQQRLAQARVQPLGPDGRAVERPRPRRMQAPRARPIENMPYLAPPQINIIKVYEVKLTEQPRVVVPPDAIDQLFTEYAQNPLIPQGKREQDAFKRRPGHEQLELIFKLQARDYYDKVEVRSEPQTLGEFRRTVNNGYVSNYFEPTFGRGQLDGFFLLAGRADSEPVAYTNFFLLNRYGRDGFRMIDRASPADSLLLQWGLPRESARNPAPEVEGWRPRFRSTEDPEYQRVLAWIGTLVNHTIHDFGLTYPPSP